MEVSVDMESETHYDPLKNEYDGKEVCITRFCDYESMESLERNLDNICIGSFKLRANVSKFKEHVTKVVEKVIRRGSIQNKTFVKKDTNFADAINSSSKPCRAPSSEETIIKEPIHEAKTKAAEINQVIMINS